MQELDNSYEIDSPKAVAITYFHSTETDVERPKRKRCQKLLDWSPVAKVQCRMGYSFEGVQLMYDVFRDVVSLPFHLIPSDITLPEGESIYHKIDQDQGRERSFHLQFDGKDTKEAVMMSALKPDATVKTMPLAGIDFKAHPIG